MSQIIKLKRSAVAGRIPAASSLDLGEIAINTYDGKLYIKKDVAGVEEVVEVGKLPLNPSFDSVFLAGAAGPIVWNTVEEALDIPLNDEVTLQVGQEQVFRGKATEVISNGDVVMFAGAQGDHLLIAKADMSVTGFRPEHVIGLATQDFANNEFGFVTSFGKVRGLDTTAFNEGDILYLDAANPGALTTAIPAPPNHSIQLCAVVRSHGTQGTYLVRPMHFPDTDEIVEGLSNLYFTNARAVAAVAAADQYVKNTGDTVTGNVTLDSSANLIFRDKNGTFPTNSGKFVWDLNNDSAAIYAQQPSSDQIDFFFKITDNAVSTDRFVFWIDDYRGAPYDKYPAQLDGSGVYLSVPVSASGVKDLANSRMKIPYSGNPSIDNNTIWHAGNFNPNNYLLTSNYVDDYVTSAAFNITNGILTLTRAEGGTVAVDLDGRYSQTDTNTTYSVSAADVASGKAIRLTGSNSVTDDVILAGGNNVSLTRSGDTITINSADAPADVVTTLSKVGNDLRYVNEAGTTATIDLTSYLDDTNLARIVDGTLSGSGILTVTRDDSTTFDIDLSLLLDDTNLARIVSAGWNTGNGVLTLTRNDGSTIPVDLDNRYLQSYTETDTLQSVTARGNSTNTDIIISKDSPKLRLYDTNSSTGSYPTLEFETANNQGISLFLNEFDGELPLGGYGLVIGPSSTNAQFPAVGDLSLSVLGEIYTGGETLTSLHKVWHAGNLNPSDYLLTSNYQDNYADSVSFNTSNGILTIGRTGSLADLTVDLDGRYITSETDSQTLSWNGTNGQLAITNGNTVDLDGRYLQSYSETDTLASVTARGATTSAALTLNGAINVNNHINFNANGNSLKFDTDGDRDTLSFLRNGIRYWRLQHSTNAAVLNFIPENGASNNIQVNGNRILTTADSSSFLTSYTETDTLQSVTARGNNTNQDIILDGSASLIFNTNQQGLGGEVGLRGNGEGFDIYEPEESSKIWLTIADDPQGNNNAFKVNSSSGMQPVWHGGNLTPSDYLLASNYVDDYVTSAAFNTTNGILTLTRAEGGAVTVDLDGRYLQTESDSQTLSWNGATGQLSISNGNTVDLDNRYYTKSEGDSLYVNVTGDTMTGSLNFTGDEDGITWSRNTDGASILFYNDADGDTNSRLEFNINDNTNEDFLFTYTTGPTTYDLVRMSPDGGQNGFKFRNNTVWHAGNFNPSNYLLTSNYQDNYVDSLAFNTSNGILTLGRTGSLPDLTVDLDNRYKIKDNTYRWKADLPNYEGSRYYKLATVNRGNGGLRIEGTFSNHVESFGTQTVDLSIFGRENDADTEIEIIGSIDVAASGTGTGIYAIKATDSGTYHTYDIYAVVPKYAQIELELTKTGVTSVHLPSESDFVTTKPTGISVELDASILLEGSYVVQGSEIYENYHAGSVNPVTGLSHDTIGRDLDITFADGTTQTVDLSQYVDDTNLSRITSGSIDSNGIAKFTRDDGTFINVNMSAFFDDTDSVDYINGASFNTSNGVLSLSGVGRAAATVDLDGRYLQSYNEADTLDSVTSRGNTTDNDISTSGSVKVTSASGEWSMSTNADGDLIFSYV